MGSNIHQRYAKCLHPSPYMFIVWHTFPPEMLIIPCQMRWVTLCDECLSLPPYCLRTETLSPSLQLSPRFANGIHPPMPVCQQQKTIHAQRNNEKLRSTYWLREVGRLNIDESRTVWFTHLLWCFSHANIPSVSGDELTELLGYRASLERPQYCLLLSLLVCIAVTCKGRKKGFLKS